MWKVIWSFIFKTMGWRAEGQHFVDHKKGIYVVAPHTSNWDFMLGLATENIRGFHSGFLIKKEWLSVPVIGWLLNHLGAVGIDRSRASSTALSIVEAFDERERLYLAITPEGTRKYSPKWKTGFWTIATKANIPIMPVALDYENKCVRFLPIFELSDDRDADIEKIKDLFRPYKGRHPENGVR